MARGDYTRPPLDTRSCEHGGKGQAPGFGCRECIRFKNTGREASDRELIAIQKQLRPADYFFYKQVSNGEG